MNDNLPNRGNERLGITYKYSRRQFLFRLLMQITMAAGFIWAVLLTEYMLALLVAGAMIATLAPVWLRRRFHIYLPPETNAGDRLYLCDSVSGRIW